MPGIRRKTRERKDGTVKYFYRYPVTDLWQGEYCPLCLSSKREHENHHVVPRIDTRCEIGYAQHWHNNIINICKSCHAKITHWQDDDSLLIYRRQLYFVGAVHGLLTWSNRKLLKKTCEDAVKIKSVRKDNFPEYEWDWGYAFFDHLHYANRIFKSYSTAHYRASFSGEYIEKISSYETAFFFLDQDEQDTLLCN